MVEAAKPDEKEKVPQHPPGTVSVLRIVTKLSNVVDIGYPHQVDMVTTGQSIRIAGFFCAGANGPFIPIENIDSAFVYAPGENPQMLSPENRSKMN